MIPFAKPFVQPAKDKGTAREKAQDQAQANQAEQHVEMIQTKLEELKNDKLVDVLLKKKREVIEFVTKAGLVSGCTVKEMTEEHRWSEGGYPCYHAHNEDGVYRGY